MSVDVEELEQHVRALAAQYPGAVYRRVETAGGGPMCMYDAGVVENGPPTEGCIIGQALALMGVPYDSAWEGVGVLELPLAWNVYPDTNWLDDVQAAQDGGNTWSEAVAYADIAN